MAIGGVALEYERQMVIGYLYPHCIDRFTFATSKPYSGQYIEQFLHPFQSIIWIGLIVVFILFLLFDQMDQYFNRKQSLSSSETITWFALRTILRQSSSWKTKIRPAKYLIISFWLIPAFILTISYSSIIQSELTVPIVHRINTIEQLIDACQSKQIMMYSTTKDFNYFRVSFVVVVVVLFQQKSFIKYNSSFVCLFVFFCSDGNH